MPSILTSNNIKDYQATAEMKLQAAIQPNEMNITTQQTYIKNSHLCSKKSK